MSPLLENLVLSGLDAWAEASRSRPGVFYWRTAGGAEVDFVVEQSRRLLPIEVKSSKRVSLAELKHLELFLSDYSTRTSFAIVLHDTTEPRKLTQQVVALPVTKFL